MYYVIAALNVLRGTVAIILLMFIVPLTLVPLGLRDLFHCVVIKMDRLFDAVAWYGGLGDTRYWPIPKAQNEPLPYRDKHD